MQTRFSSQQIVSKPRAAKPGSERFRADVPEPLASASLFGNRPPGWKQMDIPRIRHMACATIRRRVSERRLR